ncbi:hypothetical protein Peur_039139 [Populus x canadensis]
MQPEIPCCLERDLSRMTKTPRPKRRGLLPGPRTHVLQQLGVDWWRPLNPSSSKLTASTISVKEVHMRTAGSLKGNAYLV